MRVESVKVCPNNGRGDPHNFVRCAPWAPDNAFACSHCGAAITRAGAYVASAPATPTRPEEGAERC